mgnify:CR=1 FL=1
MSTTPKISFAYKIKKPQFKFKFKQPIPRTQFQLFVELCNKHSLPYFQFYDHDSWRGPVTKVTQEHFDPVIRIFDTANPYIKTIILHGDGFVIIKPIQHIDDSNIHYHVSHHNQSLPIIPFNSDDENDNNVEEEFQPEQWTYNNYTYLLDTITNYLYEPSTLEFIGKKTGEFSIDYEAKEA